MLIVRSGKMRITFDLKILQESNYCTYREFNVQSLTLKRFLGNCTTIRCVVLRARRYLQRSSEGVGQYHFFAKTRFRLCDKQLVQIEHTN
jgi:hypothetical protein